ncbi:MAG: S8/S53 family peptidase [Muribaculaceae bacterium]
MIKKLLLSLVLAFVVLTVDGQSKLSPYTLSFIRHNSIENSTKSINKDGSKLFAIPKIENGTPTVGAFVTLADGASTDEFASVGAVVCNRFGNKLTVQVPISNIVALSELSSVKRVDVEKPYQLKNDKARIATKTNLVQAGTGFKQPFTGKDVVYGAVDTGIDVNHIAFSDANGISRVKKVYFPSDLTGKAPVGVGANGDKYVGSEYTTPAQIAKLGTDTKTESHGTHTVGIAVGGYKGNEYYGMAPDADLVLSGTEELTDVNIINSVSYAMNYATSVGKPAVVNLSLGGHQGAHDGSSFITNLLDKIADTGKIIVMSSGNEGNDNLYINKKFSSTSDQLKSFITPFSDEYGNYDFNGYIDAWSRTNAPLDIQVVIYDKVKKTMVYQSKVIKATTAKGYEINSNDDKAFAKYFNGHFYVWAGEETDLNGKYNCWSEYQLEYATANGLDKYYLGVIYTSTAGAQMDAWIDDYNTFFSGKSVSGWSEGNADCSISDMATGNETISVGAYGSRDTYKKLNGEDYHYNNVKLNNIAYFSSYGPDINGVVRPDIVGPGYYVVSSVNSFDKSTVVDNHSFLAAEITANGRKYQWADMAGTSMSSPAVAGIIALWLQADPTLDAAKIKEIFKETAIKDSYVTGGNPNKWGFGKIDANAGLIKVLQKSSVEGAVTNKNVVIMYPNPSDGHFTLYAQGETGNIKLNIYNANGALVSSKNLDASQGAIDVNVESELSSGLYIVQIIGEKTNLSSRLIIK